MDAASLWVMLQMVGVHLSFWVAFPSFLMASMVATVSPLPLGLGTFEVTCVSMLGVPGMLLVRRALR
ncbi:MAG: lysylphosphatidylglycerol synthase domain-containing protein [Gammaproteobacteria bacterium]